MRIETLVPWQLKMRLKMALGAMPGAREQLGRFLPIFRHGPRQDPEYYLRTFAAHFGCYLEWNKTTTNPSPPVMLELGPGFSLASAILGYLFGAEKVILIDVGSYASLPRPLQDGLIQRIESGLNRLSSSTESANPETPEDHLLRRSMDRGWTDAKQLRDRLNVLSRCDNLPDFLTDRGFMDYRTRGLVSLRELASKSVHFSFSQAVLEHVRQDDFIETLQQLNRVAVAGGLTRHVVDFKDHLAYSLNSLRFSSRWWERKAIYQSGFYTNRLRCSELMRAFGQTGWETVDFEQRMWETIPLERRQLHPVFQKCSDEDLRCSGLVITARQSSSQPTVSSEASPAAMSQE